MTDRHRGAIARDKADPAKFGEAVLGDAYFPKQRELLQAIRDHPVVAVKGCHASGKTRAALGCLPLWWLFRYQEAVVVVTAPGMRQVKTGWREIGDAQARSRVSFPVPTTQQLDITPHRYATGISTSEAARFRGCHSPNLLIIVDEAPGLWRQEIWDEIDGLRAGGNCRLLMLGNPTSPGGRYHDAFHKDRAACHTITISAFDTPNLQGLTTAALMELSPDEIDRVASGNGLVTRRWCYDYIKRWGLNHPKVRARVLAEFPVEAEDALIPLSWIERAAAKLADLGGEAKGWKRAGLDVAGPGENETVLVIVQGGEIIELNSFHGDARGEVAAALASHKNDLEVINVDPIGIGWYFARHLEDLGFPVQDVNVGVTDPAIVDREHFVNLKAQLYWLLRERFERGEIHGVDDDELQGQLSDIRYDHDIRGAVTIESKEHMRSRGAPSPDRAEALMLAGAPILPRDIAETVVYHEPVGISRY